MNILENCTLCPRNCKIDRTKGEIGYCGATDKIKVARSSLHFWEEPCISGTEGSGTVFFSHCNMGCVFCQNHEISKNGLGKEISIEELSDIFLVLAAQGANNINLVTPTHYVPQIIKAIELSKAKGLHLPILYNSSGYECLETLKLLEGYIDIYLPDMKYFNDKYAIKYSNAKNYFDISKKAINEMFRQVGECQFDENGLLKKGVIVRHLMLPGLLFDTKKILDYLYTTYENKIYISIMSQYTPLATLPNKFEELKKKLNPKHYDAILDYATSLGIENAYIQEGESASESFIPEFFGE